MDWPLDRRILAGAPRIIGIDEVGRGSLAGPVVVSGVAWESVPGDLVVRDSKRMTPRARTEASEAIRRRAAAWAVVEVWPWTIDGMGIVPATRIAMRAVARRLWTPGSVVVVDAMELDLEGLVVVSEVRADGRYFSVATASVVAKVHRDALLRELAGRYPLWGWERNAGYGTREHRMALQEHGPGFLHRRSFGWSPVLP